MLNFLKTWLVMVLMVALAAGQGSPSAEKRTSKTSRPQVSQIGASAPTDAPTPDNGKPSGSDFEKMKTVFKIPGFDNDVKYKILNEVLDWVSDTKADPELRKKAYDL